MAYAIGHISGCHLNPAVTLGLVAGGRFKIVETIPYILSQLVGAVIGCGILFVFASGTKDFSVANGFASNGFGTRSPGGYNLVSALLAKAVLTFVFLMIILGSTDKRTRLALHRSRSAWG